MGTLPLEQGTLGRAIRTLEEAVLKALKAGQAVVLKKHDYLVTAYRRLGDGVAKGVRLREITAEPFSYEARTSKGKGGSMHMAAPHHGLMAATGIVASGAPIANRLARAAVEGWCTRPGPMRARRPLSPSPTGSERSRSVPTHLVFTRDVPTGALPRTDVRRHRTSSSNTFLGARD